jgi:hypothetical protein
MREHLRTVFLAAVLVAPATAAADEGPSNEDCQTCHTDPTTQRADGKAVLVDDTAWKASIHGEISISCTDCHADLAGKELPHADDLAPAQCISCHEKAVPAYQKGVHRLMRKDGKRINAACNDCHGDAHKILASGDRRSPTHHLNLIATCAECHDDPKLISSEKLRGGVVQSFVDSIHGRAVREAGLVVAPTCATCHGAHDVRKVDDADSTMGRAGQAAACGKCHVGIEEKYVTSVHGELAAKGEKDAPVCSDCHTAHAIKSTDLSSWKLDVIGECGTCHEESLESYRDNFHGRVTELGFTRMAKCADCHGAHDIAGMKDAKSRVTGANRIETCRSCHPGATASFAQYDPHANPSDPERSKPVYYTALAMKGLLAGVFGFFGLHTILWLGRGISDKVRKPRQGGH